MLIFIIHEVVYGSVSGAVGSSLLTTDHFIHCKFTAECLCEINNLKSTNV